MKSLSRFASAAVALLALASPRFVSAATPTLVDTGISSGYLTAANASGQAVGYSPTVAFLIDPATGVQVLPTIAGATLAPGGIAENGIVWGTYNPGGVDEFGSAIVHTFTWSPSGGARDIGTLPGGQFHWPVQANKLGQFCGYGEAPGEVNHATFFDGTTLIDLGTLGGPTSYSVGLNNHGQVVGYADHPDAEWAPFIWDATNGMREIPTGANISGVLGINDNGVVFLLDENRSPAVWDPVNGFRSFADPNPGVGYFSMMWTLKGFFSNGHAVLENMRMTGSIALVLDPDSGLQTLSLPGGAVLGYGARSFSKSGYVVSVGADDTGVSRGYIWDEVNGARLLPSLGAGYSDAWAVNELGQVTGTCYLDSGENHVFLWDAATGIQDLGPLGAFPMPSVMGTSGLAGYYYTADWSEQRTFYAKLDNPTASDTTPPTLTLPSAITVAATSPAGANVSFTATATDDTDGSVPVTLSKASGSVFALGTTTVTATATDAAGNTVSGTFTVTVVNAGPGLTLPSNLTVEATGPNGANVSFSTSAVDVITGKSRPVKYSRQPGSKFPLGTTTVTVTATGSDGKKATGTFTVTVVDTTAPTLRLPDNRTVKAKGPDGAKVTFNISADDIADRNVTVTCSPASGSVFPLGTTTVVVTATDDSGNSTSASFTVTVSDQTKPWFTQLSVAPKTITANNQMTPVTVSASVTDKVDPSPTVRIIAITCDEAIAAADAVITGPLTASLRASRDANGNGRIYTLTVQATDASGNTRTRTVHVLVPKKSNTRFDECDRGRRNEEQRCADEDRDNDRRDRGCEDDND